MQQQKNKLQINFFLLSIIVFFSSCKTSGELVSKRNLDPSGVQTVEEENKESGSQDSYKTQVEVLQGKIEDIEHAHSVEKELLAKKIAELELEVASSVEKLRAEKVNPQNSGNAIQVEGELPKGKSGVPLLWELAIRDVKAGRYKEALSPVRELASQHPKDPKHFQAILTLGMLQYELGQFKDATLTFNEAIDRFSKHKQVSYAWFGQGASLSRMGNSKDALLFFEEVIVKYPKSIPAKESKKILAAKNKKVLPLKASLFYSFPEWANSL